MTRIKTVRARVLWRGSARHIVWDEVISVVTPELAAQFVRDGVAAYADEIETAEAEAAPENMAVRTAKPRPRKAVNQ